MERIWMEVNADALRSNYRTLARRVAPLDLFAVVKADAYNVGAASVAEILKDDVPGFCVAMPSEAAPLLGFGRRVRLLGGLFDDEIELAVRHDMIPAISSLETAEKLNREAARGNRILDVMVKLDTGMGRFGFLPDVALDAIRRIDAMSNLRVSDLFSHFPIGRDPKHPVTLRQLALFKRILAGAKASGVNVRHAHIANSDAIASCPESIRAPFTAARVGIGLYGYCESPEPVGLRPAVSLRTRVIAVRRLPAGATIGYECTRTLEKDTTVALVSAGYADGLPLQLSNHADVLIRGRRCRILGRISMDYTEVSLDPLHGEVPEVGEVATLLGDDGAERASAEDWARLKGSHAYDVLCSLHGRTKRIVVHDGDKVSP